MEKGGSDARAKITEGIFDMDPRFDSVLDTFYKHVRPYKCTIHVNLLICSDNGGLISARHVYFSVP